MSAQGPVRAAVVTSELWETPAVLFNFANRFGRFDLDAAANEENHKCSRWLGPGGMDEDALSVLWCDYGQRIWVNPPYGKLGTWVTKMVEARALGCTVWALLPANTDTQWFARCWETAQSFIFLTPRVSFEQSGVPVKGNTGGSMFVVWTPDLAIGEARVSLVNWRDER